MILDQFGTALLEAHCFLCAEPTNAASLICEPCWCDLVVEELTCKRCGCRVNVEGVCAKCLKNAGDIDSTTTLVSYQFPASKLLLSLKYQGQLVLAREFGRRLSEKICAQNETLPECIVPVPLHPARLIGRGYNQALEISRVISKRLCVPLRYSAVKRTRNTLPQFKLDQRQRRKNIQGAFKVSAPFLAGSVAIVDDIVTTGNTANELARQLKAAGATEVQLWACAHAG